MSLPDLEILETEEGGNTLSPSSSPALQPLQYVHHTFTWNNHPVGAPEILCNLFNHIAYDYVFQEEMGEKCHTPHLQGVVSLKKRMRWSEFGLPRCIHWEKVSCLPECYAYCSNPNKRYGNIWSLKYKAPPRLNLLHPANFYDWQKELITEIQTEPDDRTIHWLWSMEGNIGKSTFCKYLVHFHRAIVCGKGNYADIINIMFKADMVTSNLVVFDLPRNNGNKISYSALESIKNGLIVNTKYETGSKIFNPPHVIVFSNMMPDVSAMSMDRWNIKCLD